MVFTRNNIIAKRLTELKPEYLKCICVELKISKKKLITFVAYYPPKYGNFSEFFEKLSRVMDLAITKYDNVVILGDINVDT